MNEVDIIKLATLAYWRFDRQHIMGAIECSGADVKTVSRNLMIAETEVKVTIADMRREVKTKRYKHRRMNGEFATALMTYPTSTHYQPEVNYFYFIVPERLKDKALKAVAELYPYAGLLVCRDGVKDIYSYVGERQNVYSVKPAKRMSRNKPDIEEITRIGFAATNTTIRYGNKLLTQRTINNKSAGVFNG